MKKILSTLFAILLFANLNLFVSCNQAKEKAKQTINKTGETVGKGTSEFINGVSEGVDETFECELQISKQLSDRGLTNGKFKITDSKDTKDNILTAYLIFANDFKQNVSVKVFDQNGQEYGRVSLLVEAKKGEAKYFDFIFDQRTNIESKSKFVIE